MSFTRFHDDPNRIEIKNLETSAMNSYVFNVPEILVNRVYILVILI